MFFNTGQKITQIFRLLLDENLFPKNFKNRPIWSRRAPEGTNCTLLRTKMRQNNAHEVLNTKSQEFGSNNVQDIYQLTHYLAGTFTK